MLFTTCQVEWSQRQALPLPVCGGLRVLGGVFICVWLVRSPCLAGKEIRAVALNPEGNSLESFPEGHSVFPPEMATNSRLVFSA